MAAKKASKKAKGTRKRTRQDDPLSTVAMNQCRKRLNKSSDVGFEDGAVDTLVEQHGKRFKKVLDDDEKGKDKWERDHDKMMTNCDIIGTLAETFWRRDKEGGKKVGDKITAGHLQTAHEWVKTVCAVGSSKKAPNKKARIMYEYCE